MTMKRARVLWFDVQPQLRENLQPCAVLQRNPIYPYYIARAALLDAAGAWALVRTGKHMRVPLWSYQTSGPGLPIILGTGIELGIAARASLASSHPHVRIDHWVLVLGTECQPHGEGHRCFVGMAAALETAEGEQRL